MNEKGINIFFKVESRFRLDRERVRKVIIDTLAKHGVIADYEVSVLVCGERKIRELHRQYLHKSEYRNPKFEINPKSQIQNSKLNSDDELHDVLSFPLEGEKSPDGTLVLGDIVLCYPQVLNAAAENNRMVDDEIDFLVDHSCLHLLGIHHEE